MKSRHTGPNAPVNSRVAAFATPASSPVARLARLAAALPLLAAGAAFAQAAADSPTQEVVVTAARVEQKLPDTLPSTTVISRQDIEASPATDLPDLLRTFTSFSVAQTGPLGSQTSVFVRGANSNQVLVLIDGAPLSRADFGSAPWELIPLDQIDHVEIVRGNLSSLYGGAAVGGVVQIFTKHGGGTSVALSSGSFGTHRRQRVDRPPLRRRRDAAGHRRQHLRPDDQRLQRARRERRPQRQSRPRLRAPGRRDGQRRQDLGARPAHGVQLPALRHAQRLRRLPRRVVEQDTLNTNARLVLAAVAPPVAADRQARPERRRDARSTSPIRPRPTASSARAAPPAPAARGCWARRSTGASRPTTACRWRTRTAANASARSSIRSARDGPIRNASAISAASSTPSTCRPTCATTTPTTTAAPTPACSRSAGASRRRGRSSASSRPRSRRRASATSSSPRRPTALKAEHSRDVEFGVHWTGAGWLARATWFSQRQHDLIGFDPVTFASVNIGHSANRGIELAADGDTGYGKVGLDATFQDPRDTDNDTELARRAAHARDRQLPRARVRLGNRRLPALQRPPRRHRPGHVRNGRRRSRARRWACRRSTRCRRTGRIGAKVDNVTNTPRARGARLHRAAAHGAAHRCAATGSKTAPILRLCPPATPPSFASPCWRSRRRWWPRWRWASARAAGTGS